MTQTHARTDGKDTSEMSRASRHGSDTRGTPHSEELRENISDAGSNLRQAAEHALPAAREQVHRAGECMAQRAESFEKSLEEYVHAKPLQSILMAAGAGLLVGLFLSRR